MVKQRITNNVNNINPCCLVSHLISNPDISCDIRVESQNPEQIRVLGYFRYGRLLTSEPALYVKINKLVNENTTVIYV